MWIAKVITTTEGDDMSYTSSEVKQRYNERVYKGVTFQVPKDIGNAFADKCEECNVSYRSVFIGIIEEFLVEENG